MNEEISARVDRSIQIGQDAIGNAIISGSGNVVIIQSSASQQADEPKTPESSDIGPNPYVGLSAFLEKDADRFFGRDEQITKLWEKLSDLVQESTSESRVTRLLPILGPSGSGKSSVARAGLIPELARRPLPALHDPRVGVFTPGAHPLEAVAAILARIATGDSVPVAKTAEFEDVLKNSSADGKHDGLRRIADALPEIATSPLILFVDQFEEIYSLCEDQTERHAFIENLLHAASDPGRHVSVVITLRTDFLGETQRHEALNTLICSEQQHVMIPSMNEAELREAITKPAQQAGHALDEATVDLLIKDTKDHEGTLPLMQFALTKIWDGFANEKSAAATYREIGGVGGALAKEAQRIYDGLTSDERRVAKRVFLGLVQLGEGTRDTRRRAPVDEFVSVTEDERDVERVIRRFASRDARLITLSSVSQKDSESAEAASAVDTAEVTHEALFDHWEQLNRWLNENREDIRFSRRLDESAQTWNQEGRPDGGLWRPPYLDLLREFHERMGHDMSALQMDFFIASQQADELRIANEKRRRLVLRALLGTAASAAVIAVCMLIWALISRESAIRAGIDAQVQAVRFSPPVTAGERINALVKDCNSESLSNYAVAQLQSALNEDMPAVASPDERRLFASGKANLAVALVRLGEGQVVWPLLKAGEASEFYDPTFRSYLIHRFQQAGADADLIAAELNEEQEPSVHQALLLSLGEFDEERFPADKRTALIPKLVDFYNTSADPGVHAAAEWLMRKWEQHTELQDATAKLRKNEQQLQARKSVDKHRWYVNTQGQTMVIIRSPAILRLGSFASLGDENQAEFKIDWSFAVANKEVTNGQFRRFLTDERYHKCLRKTGVELDKEQSNSTFPATNVDWFSAAAYCNWLTEQEMGVDAAKTQLCYIPIGDENGKFDDGMQVHPNFLQRSGYRLPTEVEWLYACRALAKTSWSHGEDEELLSKYARYGAGSAIRVGQLKPNEFGFFDMEGNAFEWCQDVYCTPNTLKIDAQYLNVDKRVERVVRGGSYSFGSEYLRANHRFKYSMDDPESLQYVGFRVARTYP